MFYLVASHCSHGSCCKLAGAGCQAIWQAICLVEWPERLGDQLVTKATFRTKPAVVPAKWHQDRPERLEIAFQGFGPQAGTQIDRRVFGCKPVHRAQSKGHVSRV